MPTQFGRGFEAFGKPLKIRGMGDAPAPAPLVVAPAPLQAAPPAPTPPQQYQPPQQQQRAMVAGRIPVYKKGDPGAPPCPVCRG